MRLEATLRGRLGLVGKVQPIDIFAIFPNPEDARDGYDESTGNSMLRMLLTVKDQWRDVVIQSFAHCPKGEQIFSLCPASIGATLQASMPKLRRFALLPAHGNYGCEHYESMLRPIECPSLQSLEIRTGAGVFHSVRLHELIISDVRASDVLDVLRACPQIGILRWQCALAEAYDSNRCLAITLPSLTILDLDEAVALPCRSINAPALEKFIVRYRLQSITFATIMQLGAASSLSSIDVSDVPVESAELEQCITELPKLRELVFSGGRSEPRRDGCLRTLIECVQRRRFSGNPFAHLLMVFGSPLRAAEVQQWECLRVWASESHTRLDACEACFVVGCKHNGFFN